MLSACHQQVRCRHLRRNSRWMCIERRCSVGCLSTSPCVAKFPLSWSSIWVERGEVLGDTHPNIFEKIWKVLIKAETDLFFVRISGRNFLPELCGKALQAPCCCSLLYRMEHFSKTGQEKVLPSCSCPFVFL